MKNGELHKLFTKTSRMQSRCSQSRLKDFGIFPGQPRILNFLYEHDGCIQHDLAQSCDLQPATVTNILAGMERSGLIFRLNDSADRRILRVFLTDKGMESQKKIEKTFADLEKDCFLDFSDQEKEAMQIFLDRIYFNLKRIQE